MRDFLALGTVFVPMEIGVGVRDHSGELRAMADFAFFRFLNIFIVVRCILISDIKTKGFFNFLQYLCRLIHKQHICEPFVKLCLTHTFGGINSATLGCSRASQVVRHKNTWWALEIRYYCRLSVLGEFFANVFSPKGWRKNTPKL